jgi:hypothetical protein
MGSFRTALSTLASLSVSGVVHNYDVDQVPDTLTRAQLPALLVLPTDTGGERLPARERGAGFHAVAFGSGARTVTYSVTHLLLVAPVGAGKGIRSHLPTLSDLLDAYFAALGANVTLGGALDEPARVTIDPGIFTHGGVQYYGCALRHTWIVQM